LSVTIAGGVAPRRDRLPIRAHPLVFGVVVFLASELMFFAALFAAYFDLREQAAPGTWPPPYVHLDTLDSSIGTALLFVSSLVMLAMTRAASRYRIRAARAWLAAGIVCALGFIAIALYGYAHDTFTIASSAYGSLYFTMTGFHLLHVVAGVGLLVAMWLGLRSPAIRADHLAGAEAISYYWHFVFVVWLGLWSSIYFIR
jgi:cytochrome c oxidase subunit III